jgi:hypothetical protein
MSFTAIDAYEIARRYVVDLDPAILGGIENVNRILGWIRSRSVGHLADIQSSLVEVPTSHESTRATMQISAFFKKNEDLSDVTRCLHNAVSSFHKSETVCKVANRRLDWYYGKRDRLDPDLASHLARMEREIAFLLGDTKEFLDSVPHVVRATSGATSTASRRNSLPYMKVRTEGLSCTQGALPWAASLSRFYGYDDVSPVITSCNRIEFVTKNYKTHRTIACEPEGNLPFQLCFDHYVKGRLLKWGVDLRSQVRNQDLALQGSLDGSLATVDLKSASDRLPYNTVAWMLPVPWFRLVDSLRSPEGEFTDRTSRDDMSFTVRYAKFSSMGNGATFVLETLVFAAACRAVGSKGFSVYGDDIVIETDLVGPLLRLLKFLGFTPNQEKTYCSGPFRESCGTNWFEGVDVTPFYIHSLAGGGVRNLAHNVNGLARIATPEGTLWQLLRRCVVGDKLLLVPTCEDTTVGVHVDVPQAYDLGLIRTKKGASSWKRYVTLEENTPGRPRENALFLWYLNRCQSDIKGSGSADDMTWKGPFAGMPVLNRFTIDDPSSLVSPETAYGNTISRTTKRKWGYYRPSMALDAVDSAHLHWWSNYLTSAA